MPFSSPSVNIRANDVNGVSANGGGRPSPACGAMGGHVTRCAMRCNAADPQVCPSGQWAADGFCYDACDTEGGYVYALRLRSTGLGGIDIYC